MSAAQVAPVIPPRPTRAQQAAAHGVNKLPDIPPRPINKRLDRSVSPANYPRSPLNEPWSGNLSRQKTNEQVSAEALPRRPSVQNLPSIGQEGMEYADILDMQTSQQPLASGLAADAAAQTRNIAHDLHLHAPKPSLPKSSAAAQVQAVTRTDSGQAASHGIGKPPTPSYDDGDSIHQVRTRNSFSRPSSTVAGERRLSIFGDEHGPAELGMRVPINPLLGDVQAPSPAPGLSPSNTGTNGEKRRPHHSRTKSGREIFTPPGSYGLHGHGIAPQDKFEKDWYAKHPEAAQIEETHGHGVYESIGSGRGSYALSSDDLNKIVRNTASRGASGLATTTFSYPDEQIGYAATEIYVSRSQQNTPNNLARTATNTSQPALESPLRKSSFPADETFPAEIRRGRLSSSSKQEDHDAVESEQEGETHIPPMRRYNKITGGEESMNETEEVRPYVSHPTEEGDYLVEHGYTVPILAADEVAKADHTEHLQPAVSPKQERRGSAYELEPVSGDVTPASRPSSRPSSIYGLHNASSSLSRFISHHDDRDSMHTPLEDVDEYEPLFPDEDDKKKPIPHSERFKPRPNSLKQRFPSQDIWEDTPSHALYSATVSTPDLPSQAHSSAKTFETPEQEAARKEEPSEEERRKLLTKEERLSKSFFAPHLRDEMHTRPGLVPRFPSSDIWEDSPESQYLVTTVSGQPTEPEPEPETATEVASKPSVPARPSKSRSGDGAASAQVAPSIPARPQKAVHAVPPLGAPLTDTSKSASSSPTDLKKVPSLPDKPKPQIPPRPGKKPSGEGLTKTVSGESAEQEKITPPVTKAKPQIPAKPVPGSKIANLRGNFMNDLNQKLGLGPPKEKEPEPVAEEAKPLEDARKGRARGPQRRAPPAKSPAAPAKTFGFSMFMARSLWTIDDVDELNISSHEAATAAASSSKLEEAPAALGISEDKVAQIEHSTIADAPLPSTIEQTDHAGKTGLDNEAAEEPAPMAPKLATNTAGEFTDPTVEGPALEKSNPLSPREADDGEGEEVVGLSQHTTVSSGQASGPELERETADPNMDAIPPSRQTTASSDGATAPLVKSPTQEPRTLTMEVADEEPGKASAAEV